MKFREILESNDMSNEFILQTLADADINAKIEKDSVIVDKSDVKQAKSVLSKIKCTKNVKGGLNEAIDEINEFGLGYFITYSIFMVGQSHVWHLLCPNGQKHTALGEFYNELQSEVDELAERFITQGGKLENIDRGIIAQYDEYSVIQEFENFRSYVSGCIGAIGVSSTMASIVDGLTDIQEVIDSKLYKFKLQ